jgi:hypothetical protein
MEIYDTANEYKAIQEAVNSQLPCEYRVSIVRPVADRFKVFIDGTVQGAGLTVTVRKVACNNFTINVSWATPTERENGDPLPIAAIAVYELQVNDTTYVIASDLTSYVLNGLSGGIKIVRIRTVDTDGLVSEWSDSIGVELI